MRKFIMETLVMPMNYVELQEDEMMYLDGGFDPFLVAQNLLKIGGSIWGGYLLTQAGMIMLDAARQGIGFWGAVQKVGHVAWQVFKYLPFWAQVAVGVGTAATIWALGTIAF